MEPLVSFKHPESYTSVYFHSLSTSPLPFTAFQSMLLTRISSLPSRLLLLGIWLFSVLFCALPLFGVGQYGLQYPGSWCFVNIHVTSDSPLRHLIYTNVFGIFTIVNLLIMVFCNIVVISKSLCLPVERKCNKLFIGIQYRQVEE